MNKEYTFTLEKEIKVPFVEKRLVRGQELRLLKLDLIDEEPYVIVRELETSQSWGLNLGQISKYIV